MIFPKWKIIGPTKVTNPSSSTKVAVNSNSGMRIEIRRPHTQARNILMGWGQRLILANTLGFEPKWPKAKSPSNSGVIFWEDVLWVWVNLLLVGLDSDLMGLGNSLRPMGLSK